MRHILIHICCTLIALLLLCADVNAQQAQNGTSNIINGSSSDSRVTKVRFSGNSSVKNGTLSALVRTRSNRELLNIPGFTVWYWLNRVNENWGEPANRLDRQLVANDIERIKSYYTSVGFLDTTVDTIIVDYGNRRYEVSFIISEGDPTWITRVHFSGFPEFDDHRVLQRFYRRSPLVSRPVNDTTFTSNTRFSYDLISQERNNIITTLRNNGFASVQRDSVRAIVQRTDHDPYNLEVLFLIQPGKKYRFGDVHINLDGPSTNENAVLFDTIKTRNMPDSMSIYVRREVDSWTRLRLVRNNILFTPGEPFNQELYLSTVRRFQNLGNITVRQFGLSADGSVPDYSSDILPVSIDMQTLPRHGISFDLFGMQRLGFGAGAGFRYINNNFFRGSERLELGLKGSFENAPNVSSGLLRSFEANAQYSLPRLTFPFHRLADNPEFINSRTGYQLSIAQINQLNFNVNMNIRFNLNFQVQHNPTTLSIVDLLEFDWFDASPTPEFRQRIENQISDPLQRELILNDFSQQFNSTLRYTLRRTNTDIIRRDQGFYNELSIEFAGTIPWLIESLIVRPGEPLQSTIPSLSLADSTLSYSRFIKVYADHRQYYSVTDNNVLAWRAFAGMAFAYGQNTQIPLNRRFFAGGSNDIRGWPPLRLGPGNLSLNQVTVNGADIKLAAFLENRQTILRNFLSTNWSLAVFADAGNIWNGPRSQFSDARFRIDNFYNDIAVGMGYGLRLDWSYVVFRIDVAYRAYDPAIDHGVRRGWFNNPNAYVHFGIGHSF